jgi:spermidine synthase
MGETKQQILYNPLLAIFFISGFLALGYQVLWSKFLLNFIGVSAYFYAIVMATFMGGLALGSITSGN